MTPTPENLDPKKIAILVPFYIGGGAEKITDIIFSGLMERYGYSVELISVKMNEHTRPRAEKLGYKVTDLSEVGPDFNAPQAEKAIIDAIRHSGAKHVIYVGVAPDAAERYRRELPGRNIIFHLHTMPLWEPRARLIGSRRFVLAQDSAGKYVKWYLYKYLKEKWFKVYSRRYAKQYRRTYAQIDRMITLTDSYRRQLNKIMGHKADGDPNSRISTLYNPFDPNSLASLAGNPKNKEVICVSRLYCPEKGVDHLIRAWNRICRDYPEWTLKIVGDGPDMGYLKWLVDVLATPRVEFCGYTADPSSYYATASILCLPSNIEGWPTVLIEAMCAGVVPLAIDCSGGVHEMLDEERGILVPPGNDYLIAKQLRRLIENPDELAKRRKLYPDYLSKFNIDEAVDTFQKMLL